ncbi:MAG: carboxypeptidase-like regulatory domain-containing protein, partial [Bryobacteraceae bacterium]
MRLAIVAFVVSVSGVWGQVSTGSLSGYVLDPAERVVPGASVSLQRAGLSLQRTSQTDSAGFYLFEELAPGDYQLSVNASGFAPLRTEGVRVEVDRRARLDVRVKLAGKGEKIVVQGRALDISTESSELGAVLDQSRIDSLPLNERDFLQLALLTPGVAPPVQDSALSTRG